MPAFLHPEKFYIFPSFFRFLCLPGIPCGTSCGLGGFHPSKMAV
jgi:hypothetical protein